MPSNKEAIIRHRIIDRMLRDPRSPYPTMDDIVDELVEQLGKEFSTSTVQKDIKAMREDTLLGYFAPIKYSKRENGYYYDDPDYSISGIPLSRDDVEAIEFAALMLQQFSEVGVFRNFGFAAEKIFNALTISTALDVDDAAAKVQVEHPPRHQGSEHLNTLLEAVRERIVVRFHYRKFGSDDATERTIHPYLLKEYRGRWYLIGRSDTDERVKTFGLDRMGEVQLAEDLDFQTDFTFDPDTYFRHAYGIITFHGEPETVRLRFSPIDGQYVKTVPLHDTQRIVREDDSGVYVELTVGVTKELELDLLGFGAGVEVLDPTHLRERMAEHARRMLGMYGG